MDRPFRKGKVHMSAPHMYHTVLEALDLKPGNSFLNVGSGSGYLSCLAAFITGESSVHGIELAEGLCEYAEERVQLWHAKLTAAENHGGFSRKVAVESISFERGNCFDIHTASTLKNKYDRIYIGAGCPEDRKDFFLSLLADDGVLVVPINEKSQLISVRYSGGIYTTTHISNVHFAPLLDTDAQDEERFGSWRWTLVDAKSLR
jgi:protein-L-isoaspartate O-methyltransferase